MLETPWIEVPTVELDAGLSVTRRFDSVPPALIERGGELLALISEFFPPSYRRLAALAALRTRYRFTAEAKALANRVGSDWQALLTANLAYDLVLASLGCSCAALATDEGPILARNMDWSPERAMAGASIRIDLTRGKDLVHRTANWPGGIGVVTGLSGRGYAVALNAVFHPGGPDRLGYPVLLFLRHLLDTAKDFDDAVRRLSTQRLMTAGLFTLVGTENHQRVVVERSPREVALRWAQHDAPIVTTNHYQALPVESGSRVRSDWNVGRSLYCVSNLLVRGDLSQRIDDSRLLYALTDPTVIQSITAQHVIARPRSKTLYVYVPRRLIAE